MAKFTTTVSIAKLDDAIEHAERLEAKADKSGDAQDYVATSVAYGNAAHLAHMYGTDWDKPKAERDEAYKMGVALNKISSLHKKRSEEIIHAAYTSRHHKWSAREQLTASGAPPHQLNVLDGHGGFTAETTKRGDTLWRPGTVLKSTTGTLVKHDPRSFFQTNNDVTKATYKVAGYRYPVIAWFDNRTKHRIA